MRAVVTKKGTMMTKFDHSIGIDFQGVKIISDAGFLVMREIDQRFSILGAAASRTVDRGPQEIRTIPCSNLCARESSRSRHKLLRQKSPPPTCAFDCKGRMFTNYSGLGENNVITGAVDNSSIKQGVDRAIMPQTSALRKD